MWGFCRWFPWLPRWWWTGMYGPINPYMSYTGFPSPYQNTRMYGTISPYMGYTGFQSPYLNMPGYTPTKEQEKQMLQDQLKMLEDQIKQMKDRLKELEK